MLMIGSIQTLESRLCERSASIYPRAARELLRFARNDKEKR
jgi:hypothetical protein